MPNGEMFSSSRSRFNITSQSTTKIKPSKSLKTPTNSHNASNKITPSRTATDQKTPYMNESTSTPLRTPRKRLSSSECLHFDDLKIDDVRKTHNCADSSIMEEEHEDDVEQRTNTKITSPTRKRPRDSPESEEPKPSRMSPPKFFSAKKPKLQTKPLLKRSLSFVAMRTPLANMLKSKKVTKKTLDPDESVLDESNVDLDSSTTSKKSEWNKLKNKIMNRRHTGSFLNTPEPSKDDIDYQNESSDSIAELKSLGENSSFKTPVRRRSLCCTPEIYQNKCPSLDVSKESEPSSKNPIGNTGGEVTLSLIIDHNMKTSTPHAELFKLAEDVKRTLKFSVLTLTIIYHKALLKLFSTQIFIQRIFFIPLIVY